MEKVPERIIVLKKPPRARTLPASSMDNAAAHDKGITDCVDGKRVDTDGQKAAARRTISSAAVDPAAR
jgi:hypothetical protein